MEYVLTPDSSLSRARKSSDFNTTQRLEVDVHFCECFKICKGVLVGHRENARDFAGQRNEKCTSFGW